MWFVWTLLVIFGLIAAWRTLVMLCVATSWADNDAKMANALCMIFWWSLAAIPTVILFN
jgi:hypothetical protein